MTTRYTEEHYEDVTLIVQRSSFGTDADYVSKRGLVSRFADLFAADCPLVCLYCGDVHGDDHYEWPHVKGIGFDRDKFLRDCGIKEGE